MQTNDLISRKLYEQYLTALLKGRRSVCTRIVQQLLEQEIELKTLYTDLFQKSLYEVGELWERNTISVAKEHLATAITEGLLNLVYARLFSGRNSTGKKVVISCAANEFHQVGGKMVADVFEMHGWDSHFLGANTPVEELLGYIQESDPDLLGMSLSVYFNLPSLQKGLEAVRADFKNLDVFIGGQAFRWGGLEAIKPYPGVLYIGSLADLEKEIGGE